MNATERSTCQMAGSKGMWRMLRRPAVVVATAPAVVFMPLAPLPGGSANAQTVTPTSPYSGLPTPSDVPYSLPVTDLPGTTVSPPVAADAPYTPAVLNLIAQLEPDEPADRGRTRPTPTPSSTAARCRPVTTSAQRRRPRGPRRASCPCAGRTRRAST